MSNIIDSLCMTWRHDYGLHKEDEDSFSSGMTTKEREALQRRMKQIYEHHIKPLEDRISELEPPMPFQTDPCPGMNCGCTDGVSHSPECRAETAATYAGGWFVKGLEKPEGARPVAVVREDHDGTKHAVLRDESLADGTMLVAASAPATGDKREDDIDAAFKRVYAAYNVPGDRFASDAAWVTWVRSEVGHAYRLLQRITGRYGEPYAQASAAHRREDQRSAFEAWITKTGRAHLLARDESSDWYLDLTIATLWTAFQAGADNCLECQRDADRYRYIRNKGPHGSTLQAPIRDGGDRLDEAIDAAMQRTAAPAQTDTEE